MAIACLSLWEHGQFSKFPVDPTLPVKFIAPCHLSLKKCFENSVERLYS